MLILPRQARDKHRENTHKADRFLGSGGSTVARDSKFRTLRVFLGDTSAKVTVGDGGSMTVRERAIMRAEMDVRELDLL
eukprot:COSAG06_NODE_134_length_22423_cov_17.315445_23_plen_79_part_00